MMTSEDLPELKANPIFLQQFLQLTLPKILAVENEGSAQPITPSQKSANPLLSQTASLPKLELWKDFKSSVKEALAKLPTIEGYQHILPPPAFRKGDLPLATMQPTVCLWLILQVWQPLNRLLSLDEEQIYNRSSTGENRASLQIGDHLPRHSSTLPSGSIPRQVVFRGSESNIRAPVMVIAPWMISLPGLFDENSNIKAETVDDSLKTALSELIGYMRLNSSNYAILTSYEHFLFLRAKDSETVEVSEPIASGDKEPTVYSALWYWSRLVAAEP